MEGKFRNIVRYESSRFLGLCFLVFMMKLLRENKVEDQNLKMR